MDKNLIERNGLEAHVDLSGCYCKACRKADEETKQRLQEELKQLQFLRN